MEIPDIMSHDSRLKTGPLLASWQRTVSLTILLMHGFPGTQNLYLAYAARRVAGMSLSYPTIEVLGQLTENSRFPTRSKTRRCRSILAESRKQQEIPHRSKENCPWRTQHGRIHGGLRHRSRSRCGGPGHDLCLEYWRDDDAAQRRLTAWTLFPPASIRLAGSTAAGLEEEAAANAARWNYFDYAEALRSRPMLVLESDDRNKLHNQAMVEALRKAGNSYVASKFTWRPTILTRTTASPFSPRS